MTTRSIDLLILVLVALLLAIGVGTLLNPLERGLKAAYFQTPDWSGGPLLTITERAIGLDGLSRRFPVITRNYSLRWGGYLYISQPGTYQFTTISDDGSEGWIDGQIVVDKRCLRGLRGATGQS